MKSKKVIHLKAVIFDMDGVIIDSESLHSLSFEKYLREKGVKPIRNKFGLIHTPGPVSPNTYQEILDRHGIKDSVDSLRERRREIFAEMFLKKQKPMPGFRKLIKLLQKEKIRIALASNRFVDHIYLMMDSINAKDFFEVIVGPSPVLKTKPAPDMYLYTAQKLNLRPKECLVIEDTETGVISAVSAGMKVIAVPTKYTMYQDFSKADKIVNSLMEITAQMLENL